MKKSPQYQIGLTAVGACFYAGMVLLRRHSRAIDYALGIGPIIIFLVLLPFMIVQAKKKAVPGKKSDWIGYAVIVVALLIAFGIGYTVTR
jgi:hypothetical protein